MEYIIKQGDNLVCSYTGKPVKALIKLIDQEGVQTQYLSREALANADKLLRALDGIDIDITRELKEFEDYRKSFPHILQQQLPIQKPFEVTCSNTATYKSNDGIEDVKIDDDENIPGAEPVNTSLIPGKKKPNESLSPQSQQLIKSFDLACQQLCQDPPPDSKGNQTGVPGWAVRNLVNEWKKQFPNKREMIPTIQKYFESPKEVVDFMLGL